MCAKTLALAMGNATSVVIDANAILDLMETWNTPGLTVLGVLAPMGRHGGMRRWCITTKHTPGWNAVIGGSVIETVECVTVMSHLREWLVRGISAGTTAGE